MPNNEFYSGYSFRLFSLDVFISTILVFVILFILPWFFQADIFKPFREALADYEITDVYFSSVLPSLDLPKETDIVIINTGVPTLDGYKELGDLGYLKVVHSLQGQGAIVIGIDHKFESEKGSKLFEATQTYLQEENVVLSSNSSPEKLIKFNENNVENGFKVGYNYYLDKIRQNSNTVRKFSPMYINKLDTFYHFGIEIANQYNPDAVKRLLERGNDEERISYKGNSDKFEIINANDVFQGNYPEDYFRNKIVLMGVVDTSRKSDDFSKLYYTPLNETTSGRTFPDMYKIIITANVISMVITDDYFNEFSTWYVLLIAFIVCYLNMVFFGYIGYRATRWFEIVSALTFFIESFAVVFLTVNLFYEYKVDVNLTIIVIVAALSTVVYELYTDTIKPLTLLIVTKFK